MLNLFCPFVRWSGSLALAGLLLLAGCQSDDSTENEDASSTMKETPPMVTPTDRPPGQQLSPRTLATRYLRYAYAGALLSSDHPLNDSLAALMSGSVGGRRLTVIDTFSVESVQTISDSAHTVRARFPRSVQIQSVTWETSASTIDTFRTLRIRNHHVHEAPHVVGWPAFQRHLQGVAPAAADSVLPRMREKLKPSSETGV
jgi:hypothetical protein